MYALQNLENGKKTYLMLVLVGSVGYINSFYPPPPAVVIFIPLIPLPLSRKPVLSNEINNPSIRLKQDIHSAFFSNQSFANVACRLLNAPKVETNTSFNQS